MGIDPDEVSSPTFTIVQAYGGGRVQHVDLYRLDPAETDDLGLEELPEAAPWCIECIEWAECRFGSWPRPIRGSSSSSCRRDSMTIPVKRPGDSREKLA